MSKYVYKAMDAEGKKLNGSIEADSDEEFKIEVKSLGLYLISYSIWGQNNAIGIGKSISQKELAVICRQFSTMLNAGISVVKCLDILCSQTTNAKTRAKLASVLEEVKKGSSLHKAMANQGKAFPFYLISSVESGEEGGTLDEVMTRMSNYFEKQYKTARQVKNAMMYPLILACLCIGVVTLLLIVVVPKFISMYSSQGSELPKPTQILIGLTNFLIHKWWVVALIVGAIFGIITLIKTLPTTRLSWDKFMLKMPVIGKLRCILVTSKFAHTMSTLSSSGISMLVSLDVVSRVINNSYVSECVKIIIDDLKRGIPLSDSIKKFDIFPMMFKSMIAVGEEAGELDELLEKTAVFYEDEADGAVKKMVALVEPLMIIIMAIIIAFVVISILLPIYTMYKNML